MPLSRSELIVLASLAPGPGGTTAISSATTCEPAMDLAIDSACDLALSEATCPVNVTTPLSRSWLTLTSCRLDWSRDFRTLSVTSGDFLGLSEHPMRHPTAAMASNPAKDFEFIVSP